MCSLLAYVLMMSEEVLDMFDLKMYNTKRGDNSTLLPAVRCCRKAILSGCRLYDTDCETVAVALQIPDSPLIELEMGRSNLQDSGVKLVSDALKSPNCQLKILRLAGCYLTGQSCEFVASVLQSSNS
uniref:Uncharacterized protein n=1 Tax=Cyprinus carpio carpio TaxID=630221 RepID=A0A9J8A8R2_CYPCA